MSIFEVGNRGTDRFRDLPQITQPAGFRHGIRRVWNLLSCHLTAATEPGTRTWGGRAAISAGVGEWEKVPNLLASGPR